MINSDIFKINSVAIIGASPKEGKVGNIILKNFLSKFSGKIYPVNPKYDKIYDLKCYPSILDISDSIDCGIVAIPAKGVPKVIKELGEKKAKLVIVISSGFSEEGEQGKILEEEIKKYIKKYNLRVIGPNCLGVYDPFNKIDTFFIEESRLKRPPKGSISVLSQSGATAMALLEWLSEENIGVSKVISYGNKIDIDEIYMLNYFKEDPSTKKIFIYLEGLKKGKGLEFLKKAEECISKDKTIVILKAGKTKKGASAVQSHTASLAGNYDVYKFAFLQKNIKEAKNLSEFLLALKILSFYDQRPIKKVCVFTNGGGFGVLCTDELEKEGYSLEEPSISLKQELKNILPEFAAIHNPIDTTATVPEEDYIRALEKVVDSKEYDAIIAILLPQLPNYTLDFPKKIEKVMKNKKDIPILFVIYGGGEFTKDVISNLKKIYPVFNTPDEAVKALYFLNKI